jgi:hypothetical protein
VRHNPQNSNPSYHPAAEALKIPDFPQLSPKKGIRPYNDGGSKPLLMTMYETTGQFITPKKLTQTVQPSTASMTTKLKSFLPLSDRKEGLIRTQSRHEQVMSPCV